jgi:hypothetical protein
MAEPRPTQIGASSNDRVHVEYVTLAPAQLRSYITNSFGYSEISFAPPSKSAHSAKPSDAVWMRDGLQIGILPPEEHARRDGTFVVISITDTADKREDLREVTIPPARAAVVYYCSPNSNASLRIVMAAMSENTPTYVSEYRADGFTVFSADRTTRVSSTSSDEPITFHGATVLFPPSGGRSYTLRADTVTWSPVSKELHAKNGSLVGEPGGQIISGTHLKLWWVDGVLQSTSVAGP